MGPKAFILLNQNYLAPFRDDADFPVLMRVFLFILYKTRYADGIAYTTSGDIMKALGAHRSQVDQSITFLTRKGLISKVNGKGRAKHFRVLCWVAPKRKGG